MMLLTEGPGPIPQQPAPPPAPLPPADPFQSRIARQVRGHSMQLILAVMSPSEDSLNGSASRWHCALECTASALAPRLGQYMHLINVNLCPCQQLLSSPYHILLSKPLVQG